LKPDLLYPELSFSIVSCAFEVHNNLGGGLPEKTYQLALAEEFAKRKIPYLEQYFSNTLYNNRKIQRNFSDFLVDDLIIVELKSNSRIILADFKQTKKDLQATDKKLGILLHFGNEQLTFKRVINLY
jgi:GxxExxY protein